jgi:hypothetical protein
VNTKNAGLISHMVAIKKNSLIKEGIYLILEKGITI